MVSNFTYLFESSMTVYKMDKRKSFVFPQTVWKLLLSKDQHSGAHKLTNQNGHWYGAARFSWLEDNDLRHDIACF